ncbi:MAG TPA: hypothetical protein VM487_05265, partial [Phycisphaerae bacterium]|nr:hypothetical protein [Phycisphaerae bacterium]
YGGTGLGFALEGFSNVLGGMNKETNWQTMKGTAGEQDLVSGREFLKRFASLATRYPDTMTYVLYSKNQLARQQISQGMGTPQYNAFITLARLGYTPRFITEDRLAARDGLAGVGRLVIVNQSVPLPANVMKNLVDWHGSVFIDKASEITIPGAKTIDIAMPYKNVGKPHNWGCPNITTTPHALANEKTIGKLAGPMFAALGTTGRCPLAPEKGAQTKVSVFQLLGGLNTVYVVAVNDAIQSNQSDWVRTTEMLVPNGIIKGELYDVTAERDLGPVAPVQCSFNDLTARVYCILPRPLGSADLRATQKVAAGTALDVQVNFLDTAGKLLESRIPFFLTISDPKGTPAVQWYRCTQSFRDFEMRWMVPANAPAGTWSVSVRCLLDGSTASLPVEVTPADAQTALLVDVKDSVIFRGSEQIAAKLKKNDGFVLPLFTQKDVLMPVAEAVRDELKKVLVRPDAVVSTYTVAYDPTDAERLENAQAENGDAFGRIKVTTVNRNDYAGTLSGWIFGKDVILLDLAGVQDNPMAESLDAAGMLWPKASAAFPGPGKAIVQIVKGAFSLGADAIVIQATDINGLMAGVKALRKPSEDWLTAGVAGAREKLLDQFAIGDVLGRGGIVSQSKRTADGLKLGKAPQPLAIAFVGEQPPAEAKPFQPAQPAFNPIPGEY